MATVRPGEAVSYALSREMGILYGVVLVGYVAILGGGWYAAGWATRGGGAGTLGWILAVGSLALGFVAILAGFVGIVYKVIADANRLAVS